MCDATALSPSSPPLEQVTQTNTIKSPCAAGEWSAHIQQLQFVLSRTSVPVTAKDRWSGRAPGLPLLWGPPVGQSHTARSHCSVGSAFMMSRSVRRRHSLSRAFPEQTVPVFSQPVRGIIEIPGALRLVLLNRLLYVLYAMLHRWHFGQREGPAAKAAPSCCSFHLS